MYLINGLGYTIIRVDIFVFWSYVAVFGVRWFYQNVQSVSCNLSQYSLQLCLHHLQYFISEAHNRIDKTSSYLRLSIWDHTHQNNLRNPRLVICSPNHHSPHFNLVPLGAMDHPAMFTSFCGVLKKDLYQDKTSAHLQLPSTKRQLTCTTAKKPGYP